MRTLTGIVLTLLCIVSQLPFNAEAKPKKASEYTHLERSTTNPKDDPDLPNILLLGDGISFGYTIPVRKFLTGRADIFRPPVNCRDSANGLLNVKSWLGTNKWDVIHVNFGISDVDYVKDGKTIRNKHLKNYKKEELIIRHTSEEYIANISKILAILKATNAKVIWATTTPVTSLTAEQKAVYDEMDVAVRGLMAKKKIRMNDLQRIVMPNTGKWMQPDGQHLTPEAYQALARKVASSVCPSWR